MDFWWVGQRGLDCFGISDFIPIRNIICCDYGQEFEMLEQYTGSTIFSFENVLNVRQPWTNYSISEAVSEYFTNHGSEMSTYRDNVSILAYRSNHLIEQYAQMYGLRLLGPNARLVELVDDNFYTFRELSNHGVRQPKGYTTTVNQQDFEVLAKQFGLPLVFKKQRSASGTGCYIVTSEEEFQDLVRRIDGETVLVTEFIKGLSYNIHAVVTSTEVIPSYPSLQLVGLKNCTLRRESYCGNDFGAIESNDSQLVKVLQTEAIRIGYWLKDLGYRGIFGVDLVGNKESVVAVDVNPRFQGSTWLLTQLELMQHILPTSLLHLLSFEDRISLPNTFIKTFEKFRTDFSRPLGGSQLILHSLSDKDVVVKKSLQPGVYRLNNWGEIEFIRSSINLSDCLTDSEVLITCGVPIPGLNVTPNSILLKVITRSSVFDLAKGELQEWISKVIEQIYLHVKYS